MKSAEAGHVISSLIDEFMEGRDSECGQIRTRHLTCHMENKHPPMPQFLTQLSEKYPGSDVMEGVWTP